MVKHLVIEKYPYHSFQLLNCVYSVADNVNTAIENAKVAILEQLELQIFFALSQPWCVCVCVCVSVLGEGGRLGNFVVFYKYQSVMDGLNGNLKTN